MSTGSVSDGEDIETHHKQTDAPLESSKSKRNIAQRHYTSTKYSDDEFGTDDGHEVKTKRTHGTAAGGKLLLKGGHQKDGRQTQRNAANARERARMRVLSKAFSRLKSSLPWVPVDTKLSKLDTLRLAASYISHLRQLLQDNVFESSFIHPVNLTWPFVVGRSEDNNNNSTARQCGATS
ncbi:musculin [Coregonus clupeaformis]|uniref:musculin n=1 Tax=Coregonus clupeaformis TaxID=59861 RepID=UPI001BE02877|nr:musculin [Coregonus clupeaformis]